MLDRGQTFAEFCQKLFEYTRYLGITWPKRELALPELFVNLLLINAGGREHCHIVIKPTGIVRYPADHLTAECCKVDVLRLYAFAAFICCIVCATMVPLG